jgi:hypothetical protein
LSEAIPEAISETAAAAAWETLTANDRAKDIQKVAQLEGPAPPAPREGQRPACGGEDSWQRRCDRPGCYDTFWVAQEHSCQRFCNATCRLALRRVLDREARYRQRRWRWRRGRVRRPGRSADTS